MSGLLKSIGDIWEDSEDLCDLIPFDRVFVGLVPTTEEYKMPYVSLITSGARRRYRTDKTDGSTLTVSFHIWVDDADLDRGESTAKQVRETYANHDWTFTGGTVIDVLDEGPFTTHQVNQPNYRAWEVMKVLTFCVEMPRVDQSSN